MGDFTQIIWLLALVLFSIFTSGRARAKRRKAQREMQPRPAPATAAIDGVHERPPKKRQSMDELMRSLQAHVSGFGVEDAIETPAPPPPPVILEQPPVILAKPLTDHPRRKVAPAPPKKKRRPRALLAAIGTREGLRRAILMREILGPPRAFEEHGQR